jgi:hypothetical protein
MQNVRVKKMINTIREFLIQEYGDEFLNASEKDQVLMIYKTWTDLRTED